MKINKLISIGLFSILFGVTSSGQSDLADITSRSKKGYSDVVLAIVDKQLSNDFWIMTVKGKYKDSVVGIKIKFKNGIKPGLVNDEMDNTSWARKAVEFSSLGKESDNFVRILSELYGIKTDEAFTNKPVVFTCFSLNSEWAYLDNGDFQFKLYFDDSSASGIYTEIFFNTNLPEGFIEIPDRDPEHREGFIKAMIR